MGLITEMSVARTLNLVLNIKIDSTKVNGNSICLYNPNLLERS